ncbi:unnamed protein product [Adineta ricciae]|uniref:Peptidase C14A caspase catalytic domain-containing protein n=1 Tax=Adineta ricciae TaxID=249248 RepID=A0A814AZQ2_ADIRI|nr:unnamed protein product [Adineta ricciae]CAF1526463.1 unnamed protein product [Adineta ricciae]
MMANTEYNASSRNSGHKIALVIGNGNYGPENSLENTINDANEMAKLLKKIGFKIQGDKAQLDLGYSAMKHILVDFQASIKKESMVLFYFAGHGVQSNNRNYLIPTDNFNENNAPLRGSDLRGRAIDAENILDEINDRHPFATFFFLDCCRTYDLRNDDLRGSRSRDLPQHSHGLITMPAKVGSLIAFACAPGTTADDGRDGEVHGLFTKYLLEHLKTPNEDIEKLLRRVRNDVLKASREEQIPHVTSLLTYDHICLFEQEGNDFPQYKI